MDGKLILGKDLDNWNDSLATRAPYDLSESDKTGPQFMTGNDLARSAKISSDWKNPVAVYAQAYNPLSTKLMQMTESAVTETADWVINLPANMSNMVAQMIVESTGKYQPIIDVVSILSDKNKREQLKKAAAESQDSLNETIDLLIDRDYPVNRFAQRVIANATSTVENRKIVRELYKQAHGVDSSKWYNEAASIIGAMVPAMAAGNIAFKGARLFGAGRNAAIDIAKSIAKGYIGAEMAGQYAEETAAQYLERTGDKNFENFTAKDASGLMATAYGAIGAQIEFMGGVEPIMAGALSKVGLRASALKAAAKIGAGEATEELLQGLTETLFRKIDGTSDKTWADGFKESLQGAAWGLFIGGTLGTTAFYANRQNLVKGIKTAIPSISDSEATLVADAMLDTAGEVSSQDPTLRNNLRQKIAMIYRDADIDNKEEAIDSLTDLEYSLITMDAVDRGIELKDHELFAGEVNELGWFRAGIPDERRADIQAINDNISDLKKQLVELNKAEEKDWEKIEEIENKLAQANQYVLEKMSDLARDDESAVRRMLRKVESKYVEKEQEKATKAAIKKGNIDIIRNILSDAGIRTRDLSGTQLKEMAKMNWKLLQGKDLGESDARLRTKVPLTVIEQNVESGNAVLLRAGYTQDQIEKMDDETWNRALLTQYRKEQAELGLENTGPEYTEEDIASWEGVEFQEQFDLADENARLDDIYPEYKGETINIDGKERSVYNSNGDRIAKSEEALRNFYKWFGDSKVIDGQGRPLVVYHGTGVKFDEFDNVFGRRGLFFTSSKIVASSYQGINGGRKKITMALYLKADNPFVIDFKNNNYVDVPQVIENYTFDTLDDVGYWAKQQGYDGVVALNIKDPASTSSSWEALRTVANDYIVFEPTQIKSVDNRGTYSSDTGNIYYQPGYASMRGDLIGDALDANKFAGRGEGAMVWGWGNYLLKNKDLDYEYYFDRFNREGDHILYKGKEFDKIFNTYAAKSVVSGLAAGKSKQVILDEIDKVIKAREDDLNKKLDEVRDYMRTYIKDADELEELIKDMLRLLELDGPYYTKYEEDSEGWKIQEKYRGDNPWRFTDNFSRLSAFLSGAYYGTLANAEAEIKGIKELKHDRDVFNKMNLKDVSGIPSFTYKGKNVSDVVKKIVEKYTISSYSVSNITNKITDAIRQAIIDGKDVASALRELADNRVEEVQKDIDSYKKRVIDLLDTAEEKEVMEDIFKETKLGGSITLDPKKLLQIQKITEGKYSRDMQETPKWATYSILRGRYKLNLDALARGVVESDAFEGVANYFKKANQKDFVLKSRASMWEFDVPKDMYLLDFSKKLNKQSKFVQERLMRIAQEVPHFREDIAEWKIVESKLEQPKKESEITKNKQSLDDLLLAYNQSITQFFEDWQSVGLAVAKRSVNDRIESYKHSIKTHTDSIEEWKTREPDDYYTKERLEKAIQSTKEFLAIDEDYLAIWKYIQNQISKIPDSDYDKIENYAKLELKFDKKSGESLYKSLHNAFKWSHEGDVVDKIRKDLDAKGAQEAASKLLLKYGIKGVKYHGGRDKAGFVTFSPTKALRRLYQHRVSGAAPKTYRGAYIPLYRFILRANRMDASTLAHEIAHDWMEVNFKLYRSGKAGENFMRVWGALEKALGISEDAKSVPEQASEAFARAYEGWLLSNKDWTKFISVDDKDKEKIESLFKTYQNELRDIYNDISNPYFKNTWGKIGELKPELKAWFDRVVNITDLDVMVERGEMTEEEATKVKLNRAIDKVVQSTDDEETKQSLLTARTLNDTQRYEVEGGNKNSLQMRLSDLAKEIDENNFVLKGNKYNTHRDMLAVAEAADNFVKTRLEDALAIINGQMAEVEGLYKEDIYTALERLALENGDLDLIDELKDSEIANLLAKELGQRVAGFRNWKQSTDIDVVSAIQSLDNKFEDALKNKKAKEQFDSALDLLEKEIKNQDKTADKNVDSILKELECK